MRLQTRPFERRLSDPENAASLAVGDDQSEPFFYKRLQRGPLLVGYVTCVFKKAIGYLYGCFHMASHTKEHGDMSTKPKAGHIATRRLILLQWAILTLSS
jgi:hypothetical protein